MPKTSGIYIGGGREKAKAFGKRTSKASPLSAEEWADVPLAVRESSIWCVWRMGTLLPRFRGADGAVREEKRKVDMDAAFFQFIDDLAKKYGGDEVADEAWLEKMAGLIESAPPEKFVDSDTLQAWLEDELQKGAGGALKNVRDANGALHGGDDGRFAKDGRNAGYTDEHRSKIGQRGDWKELGLPAGRDIKGDPVTPKTKIQDARERLEKGESVKTILGEDLNFDDETRRHIFEKGRPKKKIDEKLQSLDAARNAIESPHEVWMDEKTNRRIYVRFEGENGNGGKVVNAVDTEGNHVYSWHTNEVSYDHYRKGKLLYVRL